MEGFGSKQKNKPLRKTPKPVSKSILWNPHDAKWPVLPCDIKEAIIGKLKDTFDALNLAIPKLPWIQGRNREEYKKAASEKAKKLTDEEKHLRSQLVMGINAVTRALERNDLCLVLADRECQPAILTNHLIMLSTARKCPAVSVPGLHGIAAKSLGLKSLVALGFKKITMGDTTKFSELVDFIVKTAPNIDFPWMGETLEPSMKEKQTPVQMDIDEDKPQVKAHTCHDHSTAPWEQSSQTKVVETSSSNPVDYSYLYIYKSDPRARQKTNVHFGANFLAFSKDSEEESENEGSMKIKNVKVDIIQKGKKRKKTDTRLRKMDIKKKKLEFRLQNVEYKSAKLGKIQANLKRDRKRKQKLKQ